MRDHKRVGRFGQIAIALCLGATAFGAPTLASAQPKQACFYHRDTDSFAPVDNQTVNLRVGMNRYYQLKLFNPCTDLDFSQAIGLRSRGSSWICEGTGSNVEIFTRSAAGRQRCPVTSVRKLSPEEVAALPKGQRP